MKKGFIGPLFIFLSFVLLELMLISLISSQTLILQMNSTYGNDSHIIENAKTTNYGSSLILETDSESGKSERIILFFNISSIPLNSIINNATLELYLSGGTGSNFNLGIYRITKHWTETGVTWNTYDGTNAWTAAGGDYDSNIYDVYSISSFAGWKSWNLTKLVQEYVNGTNTNYGFILIPQVQAGNNYKQFTSKNNATSFTPKLIIDYISDITSPQFSNYIENPGNNSAYLPEQNYQFNVTINESNPASVWIEFNGINYSVSNISNVYTFSRTNLAAGSYSYRWWANDTLGNINNSGARYYSVARADNILTLLSSAGWNYNYGILSTFSCSAVFGTPGLYINNLEVSNPISFGLGAGNHFVKCNISESQNYSGSNGDSQNTLTVNKASSQTSLTFDKTSPQIYGSSITPICSVISGIGNPELRLNEEVINSGEALDLGAGNYNFNCSLLSSQNYTYSENISNFIINPVSTTTNVSTSPESGIEYGTESNFSCSNSAGLTTILYINGINKNDEKGLNIIRGAGEYTINCSFFGNQNYSASSEQINYIINKSVGNVDLYLNGQETNITIDYPQQYNITVATLYGNILIYLDGTDITLDNGLNITPPKTAHLYNVTAISFGDENYSSASLTRWLNITLDEVAPEINLVSPQDGASYGENTGLPLEFSVLDVHLDSCWYNLNNGVNVTIANCENMTFNAGVDGSYTFYLYANDSLGNTGVKTSTFSILVGSPTIILNSPIGIYLNSPDVEFRYLPTDLDLESCELWGNFDGEFKLNQTEISPINNAENIFDLRLLDGIYKWNIKCNDSIGHSAFNGNKTFYVDTIAPIVSISEPRGTKTSRIDIPIKFSIIDASPSTCWYNVKYTTGQEVWGNTSINCSETNFGVSTNGDYILTFYVKDFANNINFVNSSFSVDTSIPPVTPPSGGDSGSSGGGGSSFINISSKLSVSKLGEILARGGDKKTLSLSVKNTGKNFLNNCRLIIKGDLSPWIYSTQTQGIAPGENFNFVFDLNVPEGIKSGEYSSKLEVNCDEESNTQDLIVNIPASSDLIKIDSIFQEKNNINISYTFDNAKIAGESAIVEIWIVSEDGVEIKRISDSFSINLEGPIKRNIVLELPSNLAGIFSIYLALSSELDNFERESIVLGSPSGTGFAILDGTRGKIISYIIFVIIIGIGVLFVIRGHKEKKIHKKIKVLEKKDKLKNGVWIFRKSRSQSKSKKKK